MANVEQINVFRHQVFVVLNSHKSSLFLSDLFNCTDVRFLFQYAVGLGLCRQARAVSFDPTNYEECLHRSEWVSEWVSDTFVYPSLHNKPVSTLRVSTSLKTACRVIPLSSVNRNLPSGFAIIYWMNLITAFTSVKPTFHSALFQGQLFHQSECLWPYI